MTEVPNKKAARIRNPDTNLKCTLKALDYSYGDLSRFVTYSKSKQRVCAVIPPDLQIEDLVQYLDEICSDIMVEWRSLENSDSVNAFYATVGSLLRVLVNVTFLWDCTKYPQHARLPGLFVNNESLNEHIVQITISWVLDLRSKDYKLNDIGATLTNLVTLLHNYVSHEFGEKRKPFCKLFLSHAKLSAFLAVTVDIVVGQVGTDPVLRSSLQHVCVEFWNAIVNWNIVDGQRFTELRKVFATHPKLKELLEFMRRRVEKKDAEAMFFLTLLFDDDDFVQRFLHDFEHVSRRCMDTITSKLCGLLSSLDLSEDTMGLVLEMLVSIASHDEGRVWLLDEYLERLLELVGLFLDKFEEIAELGGQQGVQGEVEDSGQGGGCLFQNAKKVMGHFFRLYGALHEEDLAFLQQLAASFGDKGTAAAQLRVHLETFQNHTLLHDNEIIDQVDRERYAQLVQAIDAGLISRADTSGPAVLSAKTVGRWMAAQKGTAFQLPHALAFSSEYCTAFRQDRAALKAPATGEEGAAGEVVGAPKALGRKGWSRKARAIEEGQEEGRRPSKSRRAAEVELEAEKIEVQDEEPIEEQGGDKAEKGDQASTDRKESGAKKVGQKKAGEEEEEEEEDRAAKAVLQQAKQTPAKASRRRGRESASGGNLEAKVKESAEVLLGLLTADLDIESMGAAEAGKDKEPSPSRSRGSTENTDTSPQQKRRKGKAEAKEDRAATGESPHTKVQEPDGGEEADEQGENEEPDGEEMAHRARSTDAMKEDDGLTLSDRLTAAEVLVQGMKVETSPGSDKGKGEDGLPSDGLGERKEEDGGCHGTDDARLSCAEDVLAGTGSAYPAVSSPEFIDPAEYDSDNGLGEQEAILVKEERALSMRSRPQSEASEFPRFQNVTQQRVPTGHSQREAVQGMGSGIAPAQALFHNVMDQERASLVAEYEERPPSAAAAAQAAARAEHGPAGRVGGGARRSASASLMEHFASQASAADAHENSSTAASDTTIPDQVAAEGPTDADFLRAIASGQLPSFPSHQTDVLSWLPSALECADALLGQTNQDKERQGEATRPKVSFRAALAKVHLADAPERGQAPQQRRPPGRPPGSGRPRPRDAAGKPIRQPSGPGKPGRPRKHRPEVQREDSEEVVEATAGTAPVAAVEDVSTESARAPPVVAVADSVELVPGVNCDQPVVISDSPEPEPTAEFAVRATCLSEQEKMEAVPVTRATEMEVEDLEVPEAVGVTQQLRSEDVLSAVTTAELQSSQGHTFGQPPELYPSRGDVWRRKEPLPRMKRTLGREERKKAKEGRQEDVVNVQRVVRYLQQKDRADDPAGESDAAQATVQPSQQHPQGQPLQVPQPGPPTTAEQIVQQQQNVVNLQQMQMMPGAARGAMKIVQIPARAVLMRSGSGQSVIMPSSEPAKLAAGGQQAAAVAAGAGAGARPWQKRKSMRHVEIANLIKMTKMAIHKQHMHVLQQKQHHEIRRAQEMGMRPATGLQPLAFAGSGMQISANQLLATNFGRQPVAFALPSGAMQANLVLKQQMVQQAQQQGQGREGAHEQPQQQADPPAQAAVPDAHPLAQRAEQESPADAQHAQPPSAASEQAPSQQVINPEMLQRHRQQVGQVGQVGPPIAGPQQIQLQAQQLLLQQAHQQQHWVNLTCPVQLAPTSAGLLTAAGVVLPPGLRAGGPQLVPGSNVVRGPHFAAR